MFPKTRVVETEAITVEKGGTLIEAALLIALLAVALFAMLQLLGKNTRDALCSPIGGLEASAGQHGEITKYQWNDQTQSCEPVAAGF
jgi:hypothetical protein